EYVAKILIDVLWLIHIRRRKRDDSSLWIVYDIVETNEVRVRQSLESSQFSFGHRREVCRHVATVDDEELLARNLQGAPRPGGRGRSKHQAGPASRDKLLKRVGS